MLEFKKSYLIIQVGLNFIPSAGLETSSRMVKFVLVEKGFYSLVKESR